MEIKAPCPLLCIHTCVKEISPLDFFKLMDMPEDSPFFSSDNFRLVVGALSGFLLIKVCVLWIVVVRYSYVLYAFVAVSVSSCWITFAENDSSL